MRVWDDSEKKIQQDATGKYISERALEPDLEETSSTHMHGENNVLRIHWRERAEVSVSIHSGGPSTTMAQSRECERGLVVNP